ncbi:MAG: hypothetical protein JNM63_16090 [Spirochaetia bacterium]|nr:hypothetical protein [Spirochaetia bacterium]
MRFSIFVFLILANAGPSFAGAQSLTFQNNYRQDGKMVSDDLVLSQKLYNSRNRETVRLGDTWFAKNNTLFVIKPESFLSGGVVRRENRFYAGDYHLFLNVPKIGLSIQNDKRELPLSFIVDETGPEFFVFPKGGVVDGGALVLGPNAAVECFAWDSGSGLDGISFQTRNEGPWEKYLAPIAPDLATKRLTVAAADRLGNRSVREWDVRFDLKPPVVDFRVGGSQETEDNWHRASEDEFWFSKAPLELALTAKDEVDRAPVVYKSTNLASGFTLYLEPLRLSADRNVFFYAQDQAGNRSPVRALRFYFRDQIPSIQVR